MTTVTPTAAADGKTLTIAIDGRFDFGAHQQFRDAYEKLNAKPTMYVIDLLKTTYLDSSALGMLLLLRDHAGGEKSDIKLINSTPDVHKILAISNFDRLFDIQGAKGESRT